MARVFNQAGEEYHNVGTIQDSVRIEASGVRLINADSGRIIGGLTFAAGGSTFVNQLGGIIRLPQTSDPSAVTLITGSSGADTVSNAGTIAGRVMLGGGNDLYVDGGGSVGRVDLGDGDDIYRVDASSQGFIHDLFGGSGTDRLEVGV